MPALGSETHILISLAKNHSSDVKDLEISWYLRFLDIFDILISSLSWYLRYLDIFGKELLIGCQRPREPRPPPATRRISGPLRRMLIYILWCMSVCLSRKMITSFTGLWFFEWKCLGENFFGEIFFWFVFWFFFWIFFLKFFFENFFFENFFWKFFFENFF